MPNIWGMPPDVGVNTERLDIVERNLNRRIPVREFDQSRVEMTGRLDDFKAEYVVSLRTWLAAKKTSKTAHFSKTVTFSVDVPAGWFHHLLERHPFLQRILRRKPRCRTITHEKTVTDSQIVEFAAVIPDLKVPAQVLKEGRKTFDVFYTVL